ncbi:MAG: type II secretion system F family protein [Acidimicrobiales bacterium]
MKSLVLLGIGAGLGVTAMVTGLNRHGQAGLARPARSAPTARTVPSAQSAPSTWPAQIGHGLTKLLRLSGSSTPLRQDLNILGRSEESLAVATTLAAVTSAAGSAVVYAGLGRLGMHEPISIMPLACLVTGLVGAVVPALAVRRSAGAARRDLVHSLACWLELVALAQAGGMGIESALEAASSVAGEASFLRIRRALDRARHAGQSPWDGLGRLGGELGVNELEELAASVRLAGTEGARIRSSLSAKSTSLRRRQMADAQGRANATTERLFLPAIVLMLGFVVFLVYPAAVTLSHLL